MIPLPIIGGIIETVGKVADDLITSDEERGQLALEGRRIDLQDKALDLQGAQGQIEVNKVEAAHPSVFVAGGRPAVIWTGVIGLAYQFVLYPLLMWGWTLLQATDVLPRDVPVPPIMNIEALMVLLTGVLGISGMRSFDKVKGVDTKAVG